MLMVKTKFRLAYGIKSYFSSCLTLTLGIKYKSEEKSDEVIFVDPYYQLGGGKHSDFRKYFESKYCESILYKYVGDAAKIIHKRKFIF